VRGRGRVTQPLTPEQRLGTPLPDWLSPPGPIIPGPRGSLTATGWAQPRIQWTVGVGLGAEQTQGWVEHWQREVTAAAYAQPGIEHAQGFNDLQLEAPVTLFAGYPYNTGDVSPARGWFHTHPFGYNDPQGFSVGDLLHTRFYGLNESYVLEHPSADPSVPAQLSMLTPDGRQRPVAPQEVLLPQPVPGYPQLHGPAAALRALATTLSRVDGVLRAPTSTPGTRREAIRELVAPHWPIPAARTICCRPRSRTCTVSTSCWGWPSPTWPNSNASSSWGP